MTFTLDEEEENEEEEDQEEDDNSNASQEPLPKKIRKNPDVDTSFLPDRQREEEENQLREELRQVYNFNFQLFNEIFLPILIIYIIFKLGMGNQTVYIERRRD